MSVALRGNLRDFGIAEVFQLIGQQRKTGVLEIVADDQTVRLAFDEGAVVWAGPASNSEDAVLGDRLVRCGLLTTSALSRLFAEGEASARSLAALAVANDVVSQRDIEQISDLIKRDTIFQVLRWSGGSFHFSAQSVQHDQPPEKLLAAEQILMDGLRMMDEWQTFAAQVPSDETIFQRCGSFEAYRQRVGADARPRLSQGEAIFALVDGRLSVRRIIDLSRLGVFEATRVFAELRTAGVVDPLSVKQARRARRISEQPVQPMAQKVRWWLAAAFPLAVLALMVSVAFNSLSSQVDQPGFPILRSPLDEARYVFEKRRLRHALEAYRYQWGTWPSDLAELARTGLLGRGALTPSDGPAYYYARREGGVVLLAPEH